MEPRNISPEVSCKDQTIYQTVHIYLLMVDRKRVADKLFKV